MKNKIIVGLLLIVSLVVGITTDSALTYQSRAEKLAELTNQSVHDIIHDLYENNKTCRDIASENDVLEEYRAYNYEVKKNIIQERVGNGYLTEEGAEILQQIEEHHTNCNYSKNNRCGGGYNRNHHQNHHHNYN